jgi:hypothetical protein
MQKFFSTTEFKSVFDSKWNMKTRVALASNPGPQAMMKLQLYAGGNLFTDNFKFGYGIDFGQTQ